MKKTLIPMVLVLFFIACAINKTQEPKFLHDFELSNAQARRLLAKKEIKENFTVAHIGDTRKRNYNKVNPIFSKMVDKMILEKVDLVIHYGDVSQKGTEIQFQNYYKFVKNVMDTYEIPFFTVVGNHEYHKTEGYRYYLAYVDSVLDYHFDILDYRFLVFCNYGNNEKKNYQFTDLQLGSLKRLIDLPEQTKKLMVLTHTPIWLKSKDNDNYQNFFEFNDILVQKRFISKTKIYCINGHHHRYAKKIENNVLYLTSGGGGGPLRKPRFLGIDEQNKYFFWVKTIHNLNSDALEFKIRFRKSKLEKVALKYNFTF